MLITTGPGDASAMSVTIAGIEFEHHVYDECADVLYLTVAAGVASGILSAAVVRSARQRGLRPDVARRSARGMPALDLRLDTAASGDPDVHQRRRRLPLRRGVAPRARLGALFEECALSMATDACVLPESSSRHGAGGNTWSSSRASVSSQSIEVPALRTGAGAPLMFENCPSGTYR
jgi:hypothetical protein